MDDDDEYNIYLYMLSQLQLFKVNVTCSYKWLYIL